MQKNCPQKQYPPCNPCARPVVCKPRSRIATPPLRRRYSLNDCITCPQGPPGEPGEPGTPGTPGGIQDYAYVYNLTPQTVAIEASVLFDSNGPITAGFTHALGSDSITIVNAGDYHVIFLVSGTEPNQFALFLNGAPITSILYGSGVGTQQNTGVGIFTASAGDVLTLVNHSSAAAIGLASVIGGTQANVNASITLIRLS